MTSYGSPRRGGRLIGALAVGWALVVVPVTPASAHGSTPDGTNYRSRVTAITDPGGAAVGTPDGVAWRVLGGDGLLQVTTTDAEVVVEGYDDEPFLRVGPDGVFENRNSPATYLNADRYANITVPADVDATAPPEWRRVSDAAQWQWHDHRIHWMAPTPPPPIGDRPDVGQRVLDWVVPFEVDGDRFDARGVLDYVPPPPVWPWLLVAAVVLALPVVTLIIARQASERRTLRMVVGVTIAVAAAGVAVAVGDALDTPASIGADAWAVVQTAVPAGVAAALAWTAWHPERADDTTRPEATLLVAAAIIAFAAGVSRLSELTSSQVTNALPADAVRAIVAASLTLVAPSLLLVLVPRRAGVKT